MVARSVDEKQKAEIALEGDRGMAISRVLRAPPHLVFEAWTKPELVKRWWAPTKLGVSFISCEGDVRVGGRYRYVMQAPGMPPNGFSGRYTEITRPSRLVYTMIYEPVVEPGAPAPENDGPDVAAIVTVTFNPIGENTLLTEHSLYPTQEIRDQVLASGMEVGMQESWSALDELVRSLRGAGVSP